MAAVDPAKMGWLDRIVNVNWGARDILVVESQYSDVLTGTGSFRTLTTAVGTGFMLGAVQVLLGGNILDPTGKFGTSAFFRLGTHQFSVFEPFMSGALVFDVKMMQALLHSSSFHITLDYSAPGMTGLDQIDGNTFATFYSKVQDIFYDGSQASPVVKFAKGGGIVSTAVDTARGLFSSPLDHFTVDVTANLATKAAPLLTYTPP